MKELVAGSSERSGINTFGGKGPIKERGFATIKEIKAASLIRCASMIGKSVGKSVLYVREIALKGTI